MMDAESCLSGRARAHEELGLAILRCNECFSGTNRGPVPHCWHHEDILGGYEPGRILVLIINAQRPIDLTWDPRDHVLDPRTKLPRPAPRGSKARALATYRAIRDGELERKLRFADEALRIFASGDAGEFADWVEHHPGQRDWLPRATKLLLGSDEAANRALLAEHFVFVDIFKHATADHGQLKKAMDDHPGMAQCPQRWLGPQLAALEPRMLLLCGGPVIATAVELWPLRDSEGSHLDPSSAMGDLHGKRWRARLQGPEGSETETWTTYALASRPERQHWPTKPDKGAALRAAILAAIERRT